MHQFQDIYSISDEDLAALPVTAIGAAVGFYTSVLGFSVVAQDDDTATVEREGARLGRCRPRVLAVQCGQED
ncbi:hypothetical protein BH11PLA2_BH11PLA2_51960 [soil metagenome]